MSNFNAAIEANNSGSLLLSQGALYAAIQSFRDALGHISGDRAQAIAPARSDLPPSKDISAGVRPTAEEVEILEDQGHEDDYDDDSIAESTLYYIPVKVLEINNIAPSANHDSSVLIFSQAFQLDTLGQDRLLPPGDGWLEAYRYQISTIALYNMALTYHQQGFHDGLHSSFERSMKIYQAAFEACEMASEVCSDVVLPLLAILNNMGHVQLSLARFESARQVFSRLQFLLLRILESDEWWYEGKMDDIDFVLLFMNCNIMERIHKASPAA